MGRGWEYKAGKELVVPEEAGQAFQTEEPPEEGRGEGDGGAPIPVLLPVWGLSFPSWELALNAVTEQPGVWGPEGRCRWEVSGALVLEPQQGFLPPSKGIAPHTGERRR